MAARRERETGEARPRGRYPTGELEARRGEVVAAAAGVFAAQGFEGASFELVSRQAGVSPKTIYAWFGGKAGLFAAVMEQIGARWLGDLARTLDPAATPHEALVQFGTGLVDRVLSPEAIALQRAVIASAPTLPEIASTFYEAGPRRAIGLLTEFLAGHSVPEPSRTAEAFVGLIEGETLRRALLGVEPTPSPADRDAAVRFAVSLLLGPARPARRRGKAAPDGP